MARGGLKAGWTLVQVAVEVDVVKFPALEAGFMIMGMVLGKRSVMVTASPPDFGASDGDFFFFGQRGR